MEIARIAYYLDAHIDWPRQERPVFRNMEMRPPEMFEGRVVEGDKLLYILIRDEDFRQW